MATKSLQDTVWHLAWASALSVLLVFGLMLLALFETRAAMDRVQQVEARLLAAVYELEINAHELALDADHFWHGGGREPLIKVGEDIKGFEEAFRLLSTAAVNPADRGSLAQVLDLHRRSVQANASISSLRPQIDRRFQAMRISMSHLNQVLDSSLLERKSGVSPEETLAAIHFESQLDDHNAQLSLLLNYASQAQIFEHARTEIKLREQLDVIANSLLPGPEAEKMELKSAVGNVLDRGRDLRELIALTMTARRESESSRLAIYAVLHEKLQPAIARRVDGTLDGANRRVNASLMLFGVLVMALSALGLLMWNFLQVRILAPINSLCESMGLVGSGSLDTRAPVQFDDELGQLALRFNRTVLALSEQTVGRTRMTALLDEIADCVIACDADANIQFVSPRLLIQLDYEMSALKGQPFSMLLEGEAAAASGSALGSNSLPPILELRDRAGAALPVHLVCAELEIGHDFRFVLAGRDRRAEVVAEERLAWLRHLTREARALLIAESAQRQSLELKLLDIAEHEQSRIGQELHDNVGQQLAGAAFLAHALAQRLQAGERAEAQEAGWISQVLAQTMDALRTISRDLSPGGMEIGNLVHALSALCARTQSLHGVHCLLTTTATDAAAEGLTAVQSRNLFRVAQEALSNALRHGRATSIEIGFRMRSRTAALGVLDNGMGFDPVSISDGMGLRSVRMRATGLGGRVRIRTGPDGTLIMLRVPLAPGDEAASS